jgi:NADH dehydrogenase/NADH:ubiquinone oxidoreductase subunit G
MYAMKLDAITVLLGKDSNDNLTQKLIEKHRIKLRELELDSNSKFLEYLDSLTEEDEVVTIELRKKTLKKIFKSYFVEDSDEDELNRLAELKTKEMDKSKEHLEEAGKMVEMSEKSKSELYERFISNLEQNKSNMGFEIEQILNDLALQIMHSSNQIPKKYSKYVSEI